MHLRPPARGYGAVAKTLHWLVFALVFAQYVVAILMPGIGRNTRPGPLINLHMSLGATILIVIVIRWLWRTDHPVAIATADMPPWEQRFARATHLTLYVLLVITPILGWMNASARDFPIDVFGVIALPPLVAPHARIGMLAGDVHTFVAWALLVPIGLHVAAALYHYFVRRDRILQRMLPKGSETNFPGK
ncbi:MAG TPA: cytochrome b [Casimicrobiaceae bacterium]|nr:cytochrome b [Casimicrobiaceae bacterium]